MAWASRLARSSAVGWCEGGGDVGGADVHVASLLGREGADVAKFVPAGRADGHVRQRFAGRGAHEEMRGFGGCEARAVVQVVAHRAAHGSSLPSRVVSHAQKV